MNHFLAKKNITPKAKGPLKGYTISVKDNICTKDLETTAGSQILRGYKPLFDATVVEKIKNSGADILAKTSMDEFGFGSFNTNTTNPPTNPLDESRVTGGSSGGSASAVKRLNKHISIAESTGGSIANPASFCGVVGYTPTYGLVSRYGLIDYANSLDKIGVIASSSTECALMMKIISGHDPKDNTSIKKQIDFTKKNSTLKGTKIGIPKEYLDVDPNIKKSFDQSIKKLENKGAIIKYISLPLNKDYSLETYYVIAMAEASTNLAKLCGQRFGKSLDLIEEYNLQYSKVRSKYLGKETQRRIIIGTYIRQAGFRNKYYDKALRVRKILIDEYKKQFEDIDIIAHPSMPCIAPKFFEVNKLQPIEMYKMDLLTCGVNLAGLPHISIPMELDNMAAGILLTANHLDDNKLLNIGEQFEN